MLKNQLFFNITLASCYNEPNFLTLTNPLLRNTPQSFNKKTPIKTALIKVK